MRIGVGHPGVKDAVAALRAARLRQGEYEWLDPLLDAMAESRALPGARGCFALPVARRQRHARRGEEAEEEAPAAAAQGAPSRAKAHPAGERAGKRAGALAENLKKWLAGRGGKT